MAESETAEKSASTSSSTHSHPTLHSDGSTDEKTIVVAVDFSERAEQAFNWYFDTLHKKSHKVICTHTIEPPDMHHADMYSISIDVFQQALDHTTLKVKELEKKYEEKMRSRHAHGKIVLKISNKPGEALVQVAKEQKADLVIMGTRGLGRIRRTILGSVSDYVVHHAHCPVLICRH
ncbi:hypothetical protein CAPTEDRAFT_21111 [Capitella teleta]|uniref:UspA domain-containing protein n=1 Tax=Capitella teleta TaxID=283909 RepID=R7VJ42_CAPTE|nr:hypothetical protein CAPTEDRAFT_21111 [Capitella teleta]|eukprot:ELU16336.1 hypothetical protein CAPTEDRAFT_21111 [Capitella teleta]